MSQIGSKLENLFFRRICSLIHISCKANGETGGGRSYIAEVAERGHTVREDFGRVDTGDHTAKWSLPNHIEATD
jgi:hypothetical protein